MIRVRPCRLLQHIASIILVVEMHPRMGMVLRMEFCRIKIDLHTLVHNQAPPQDAQEMEQHHMYRTTPTFHHSNLKHRTQVSIDLVAEVDRMQHLDQGDAPNQIKPLSHVLCSPLPLIQRQVKFSTNQVAALLPQHQTLQLQLLSPVSPHLTTPTTTMFPSHLRERDSFQPAP